MLLLIKIVSQKKHILILLESLQSITQRSMQNKITFVKLVMATTLTVEYNPNDLVVVVINIVPGNNKTTS